MDRQRGRAWRAAHLAPLDLDQYGDLLVAILEEVQTGEFAREWILENMAGRPVYNAIKREESEHEIEVVGRELRGMMSWLGERGKLE